MSGVELVETGPTKTDHKDDTANVSTGSKYEGKAQTDGDPSVSKYEGKAKSGGDPSISKYKAKADDYSTKDGSLTSKTEGYGDKSGAYASDGKGYMEVRKMPRLRSLRLHAREIGLLKITNTLQFVVSLIVLILALTNGQKLTVSLTVGTIVCPILSILISIFGGVILFFVIREDTADARKHGHKMFLVYIVTAVITCVVACLFTAGSTDALLALEIIQILLLLVGVICSLRVYEDIYHVLHIIAQLLNLGLYLLGALILVLGVVFAKANSAAGFETGVPQFALIMFAILGGGIALLACLGFFGITRGNKYMMCVYEFLMLFVFVGLLIAGAVVLKWDVRQEVGGGCAELLKAADIAFWSERFSCDKYIGFTISNPVVDPFPVCTPKTDIARVYESTLRPYPTACLNRECCDALTDYVLGSTNEIYALGLALFLIVVFLIVSTYLFIVRDVQKECMPGDPGYDASKDKDLMYLTTWKSHHPEDTAYFCVMVLVLIILIIVLAIQLSAIAPVEPFIAPANTWISGGNSSIVANLGLSGCVNTDLSSNLNVTVGSFYMLTLTVGRGLWQWDSALANSSNVTTSLIQKGVGSSVNITGDSVGLASFLKGLEYCPLCVNENVLFNFSVRPVNNLTNVAQITQTINVTSSYTQVFTGLVLATLNTSKTEEFAGVSISTVDAYGCPASRANATSDASGKYSIYFSVTGLGGEVLKFSYAKQGWQSITQTIPGIYINEGSYVAPTVIFTRPSLCVGTCFPGVTCVDIISEPGFICGTCPPGYHGNGTGTTGCVDDDECTSRPCDPLTNCTNTLGSFTCSPCPPFYSGNGKAGCNAINYCLPTSPCSNLSSCTFLPGAGFECGECAKGYMKVGDGRGEGGCIDINECNVTTPPCSPLVTCNNTIGYFNCSACPPGYRGSGFASCIDIDECQKSSACPPRSQCNNTIGNYTCTCDVGTTPGDNNTCVDCNLTQHCLSYNPNGPRCVCSSCSSDYYASGGLCVPCDCPNGTISQGCGGDSPGVCAPVFCPANSTGPNVTAGCRCFPGLTGSIIPSDNAARYEGNCVSCDEPFCATFFEGCNCTSCKSGTDTYADIATGNCVPCVNNCANNEFLSGCSGSSPGICTECNQTGCIEYNGNDCDCTQCADNYYLNDTVCLECDPCPAGQFRWDCSESSPGICSNVSCGGEIRFTEPGQVFPSGCTCQNGTQGPIIPTTTYPYYSGACEDIDECLVPNNECVQTKRLCKNLIGGFECPRCPDGLESLDGISCIDINECLACNQTSNANTTCPCDWMTRCDNLQPGYTCSDCPSGFVGSSNLRNGNGCEDEDECETDAFCFPNWPTGTGPAVCDNTVGSFNCSCKNGFRLVETICPFIDTCFECVNIDECAEQTDNCHHLVDCIDTYGSYTCGSCPPGYVGNGTAGCVDEDECARVISPCTDSICTNVNLSNYNLTKESCICDGKDCVYVRFPAVVVDTDGKYTCVTFARITTRTWSESICVEYEREPRDYARNASMRLTSVIRSTRIECGTTAHWNLQNKLGTLLYQSEAAATRVDPNRLTTFVSVINSTNPQLNISRCAIVNGKECFTIENALPINVNGQYLCEFIGASGCEVYLNTNQDKLSLFTTAPASNDCEDEFHWELSNMMDLPQKVVTLDPRQGPTFGDFPSDTFENCTYGYRCGSCPSGTDGSPHTQCSDINECALDPYLCDPFSTGCNGTFPSRSYTCGPCLPGYTGSPCVAITNETTVRITILNAHFGTPSTSRVAVDAYEGSILNPTSGAVRVASQNTTAASPGFLVMKLPPGLYTIFATVLGPPTFNGPVGAQNVRFSAGQDIFLTLYWVPRSVVTVNDVNRPIVLTWQAKDAGTANVDLDLVVQKYHPTQYSCSAACCVASSQNTPCGATSLRNDSKTSDGVEEMLIADFERAATIGDYTGSFSYFVYVRAVPPTHPAQLKRSNAQIRIFSRGSLKNADASFDLSVLPSQLESPAYTPQFWVAFCLKVAGDNSVTFKNLANGSSTFFFPSPEHQAPQPSMYCN